MIIRVQFPGEMQSEPVNITRQMHPAAHRLARTARINDFAHDERIDSERAGVNSSQSVITPMQSQELYFGTTAPFGGELEEVLFVSD